MTGAEISERLHDGRYVYGTAILSPSPFWPEAVRNTGVDFVFIDTEHVPIERTTLSWMCNTYRALNIPPIVRIPSPDPVAAEMALDGGATGIIAPYVESADEVRELVGAVKLRPLRGKLRRDVLDDRATLNSETDDYIKDRNVNSVLIANVESVPAMDRLDEILDVEGLDAVLIGPHDLSVSLGIPEKYGDPLFDRAVREIYRKARKKGVGAGIHFFWEGLDLEIEWAKAGGNLVIHSADYLIFEETLRKDLNKIREALGGDASSEKISTTVV